MSRWPLAACGPSKCSRRAAARPFQRGEVIGGRRALRGANLDQVLDLEPVRPQQADPLSVGELEADLIVAFESPELEVVVDKPVDDAIAVDVVDEVD
jgi:hypothetical protein